MTSVKSQLTRWTQNGHKAFWPLLGDTYNYMILKEETGANDGARTRDNRNHNPGLYQLSYSHHMYRTLSGKRINNTV